MGEREGKRERGKEARGRKREDSMDKLGERKRLNKGTRNGEIERSEGRRE
jgi:hypothetical protein